MKIKIVRGAFLNPFELQNFYPLSKKHKIEVISSKFPLSQKIKLPLTKLWSPADIPNIPFKYPILNRLFIDGQVLYGLEKHLAGADIVHTAETYFGYTFQALKAKRRGKVKKVITTVWETIPYNNEGLKGRKSIKRYAKENIDHYLAVTQRAKRSLLKEGIAEEKITVIPMGVDLKRFSPSKKPKNKRDINILCVARLTPEKGVLTLLKAFLEIRKTNKNLNLYFIGSGSLSHELKGYKNVFVKNVPYEKIHHEYNKADIFCLPSHSTNTWEEQFGMCLVEAMASGLPIVSTNSGAIPEVCEDIALLVKPDNVHNLSTALEKLIYNKELRESTGMQGRKRAEKNYNRLKIAKKINLLYKKVICR